MKEKVVVIYSGGMDSFTVLHSTLQQGYEVYALSFDYGQKHSKELQVASKVCKQQGINHKLVNIKTITQLLDASSLISNDQAIPEGHYTDASMQSTVVPNRNMILLSLAIGYGVSIGAEKIYYGAHAGDHAIYPDCREEFVHAMNQVAAIANYQAITIITPYLRGNKSSILADGLKMGLDYTDTWTCYNGRARACGKCGSCVERLEAFADNQLTDPLSYET